MKSPENSNLNEIDPKKTTPDINSHEQSSNHQENEHHVETNQEKEKTDEKIEEVLSWLKEEQSEQPEFRAAVENLKTERAEKEKGTFSMLRELWSATPNDCKSTLLGEFILNPNALKARYFQEKHFQANLKRGWKK